MKLSNRLVDCSQLAQSRIAVRTSRVLEGLAACPRGALRNEDVARRIMKCGRSPATKTLSLSTGGMMVRCGDVPAPDVQVLQSTCAAWYIVIRRSSNR